MEQSPEKQTAPASLEWNYIAVVICFIATFSAIQEGYYSRKGREIV